MENIQIDPIIWAKISDHEHISDDTTESWLWKQWERTVGNFS